MNPADLLTTLAELGVALAGFSGIVVALGRRATGEWAARDRVLLGALIAGGGGVVFWSLLPLLLLAAGLAEASVWRISSGGWALTQVAILVVRVRDLRRDPELARDRGFAGFAFAGGVAGLGLQVTNLLWLATAWPHLTAVTWHLALSYLVFARLLRPDPAP